MGKVCGHCVMYREVANLENICSKTGKVVPFLSRRDCFEERIEVKEETEMKTKVCKDCGRELPIESFGKSYKSPDGYAHICRECKGKRIKNGEKDSRTDSMTDKELQKFSFLNFTVTDQELVDELRSRGWAVKCTKMIEL